MGSVFTEVVVDCEDPRRVADFWANVLGWPVTNDKRGYCWISSDGGHTPPIFVFVPVPEGKTVKNRVHIDVNPSGCDPPEELERLLALGATKIDVGQGDVPWVVLADPEGNEFCLLGRRVDA